MSYKNLITHTDVHGFIQYLRGTGQTFEVSSTNYSKTIKWKNETFSFITEGTKNAAFICFNKIRADIKRTNIVIDEVNRFTPTYYSVSDFSNKRKELPKTVFNIDIKSAYLTTLYNAAMISRETYDYVNKQDKQTRLKAVGMLATSKLVMTFAGGELTGFKTLQDDFLRNYFFFCCYQVGETMNHISHLYREAFLFFWVDGIYLSYEGTRAKEYLTQRGYKYTVQRLDNCTFDKQKEYLMFTYSNEGKEKKYCIPYDNNENKSKLLTYLNYLKNESINVRAESSVKK